MEVTELKELCNEMFRVKAEVAELDDAKKKLNITMLELKTKVMIELEKNEMKSFKTGDMSVTKVDKKAVKILDKNLFLDYLEDRGVLRDALNVTVAKATTIYNEEYELAMSEQNQDLIINGLPGLSSPETYSTISMRGKL